MGLLGANANADDHPVGPGRAHEGLDGALPGLKRVLVPLLGKKQEPGEVTKAIVIIVIGAKRRGLVGSSGLGGGLLPSSRVTRTSDQRRW